MKKLLLLCLIFSSCIVEEGEQIRKVEPGDSNTVIYTTSGSGKFIARKGLYNIGDIVKFTK